MNSQKTPFICLTDNRRAASGLPKEPTASTHTQEELAQIFFLVDEKIGETCRKIKLACGARAAHKAYNSLQHLKKLYFTSDLTDDDYSALIDEMIEIYIYSIISAQIRFTPRKYRSTLTPELIRKRCLICGVSEDDTMHLIKEFHHQTDLHPHKKSTASQPMSSCQ